MDIYPQHTNIAQGNLHKPNVMRSCPFCGSDDLTIHEEPSRDKTVTWYKILHPATSECSVSMLDSNKEKLIERWTKRA